MQEKFEVYIKGGVPSTDILLKVFLGDVGITRPVYRMGSGGWSISVTTDSDTMERAFKQFSSILERYEPVD
jgi:hypothetical protein